MKEAKEIRFIGWFAWFQFDYTEVVFKTYKTACNLYHIVSYRIHSCCVHHIYCMLTVLNSIVARQLRALYTCMYIEFVILDPCDQYCMWQY